MIDELCSRLSKDMCIKGGSGLSTFIKYSSLHISFMIECIAC